LVYRKLRQRKSSIVVFSTAAIGVAFALRAVLLIIWGPEPRTISQG
jgi:branched-subunit amino acid ABC-type transport system permease component